MQQSGEVYVQDSRPNNLLTAPMHTIRIFIMGGERGGGGRSSFARGTTYNYPNCNLGLMINSIGAAC